MKLNKFIYVAIFMLCVCGVTSCSDSGYWDESTNQNGFSFKSSSQSFTFTNNDVMDVVEIPITRANASGEATLPLEVSFSSDLLSGPSSVTFADGQKTANYVITCTGFELGDEATATVQFDKTLASAAGVDSTKVTVLLDYVWNSIGVGKFNDAWTTNSDETYDVEFMQNASLPNRFRVMYPYTSFWGEDASPSISNFVEFWVLSPGDVLGSTTVTKENLVYFKDFYTGEYVDDYDAEITAMHPARFTSMADESNWLCNKVLSTQENGLPAQVQLAPMFYMMGVGGYNYTQYNGVITITFPGVKIYDYSGEVTYNGRSIDAKDKEAVNVSVKLGSDVDYAKIAIVATGNAEDALYAVLDDKVETTTITESGDLQLPFDNQDTGKYTIMLVTYDENDEAEYYDYDQFTYGATPTYTWEPIYTGNYVYTQFFGSEEEPETDADLVLYECVENPDLFKIEHWGYDVDFVFTFDDDGNVMVSDQPTGYEHSQYGMVMVDDLVDYTGGINYGYSYYEDGVFNFAVIYYVSGGYLSMGNETFYLTGAYARSANARLEQARARVMAAAKNVTPTKADLKVKDVKVSKDLKSTKNTQSKRVPKFLKKDVKVQPSKDIRTF